MVYTCILSRDFMKSLITLIPCNIYIPMLIVHYISSNTSYKYKAHNLYFDFSSKFNCAKQLTM